MNKDINIKVVGSQKDLEGELNSETTIDKGLYYNRNNTHFVIVEDEILAKNDRYKFNHRYLEVIKNGDINAKLYFETGKSYTSEYRTPYGRMLLTFVTSSYSLSEEAESIKATAKYSIYNNDLLLSENTFCITLNNA